MTERKRQMDQLQIQISKLAQTEKFIQANLNILKGNIKKTILTLKQIDGSFRGSNMYQQLGKAFLLAQPQNLKKQLKASINKQQQDIKQKEDQKQQYQKKREQKKLMMLQINKIS